MIALTVGVLVLAGCSTIQQEADTEAARLADHAVPDGLAKELRKGDASTPEARGRAAEAWFSTPDPKILRNYKGATWVVRAREETSVRVDVYQYVESGSFFPPDQGEGARGVACRIYDVADDVVTRSVDCPPGTRDAP